MSTWISQIEPDAKDDVAEAYAWYEKREPGIGPEFLADVEATLERIQRNPELCQKIDRSVRFQRTKRFPYVVYFILEEPVIVVIAILHRRRDSSRWKSRL